MEWPHYKGWQEEQDRQIELQNDNAERVLAKYPRLAETLVNWGRDTDMNAGPLTTAAVIDYLARDRSARDAALYYIGQHGRATRGNPGNSDDLTIPLIYGILERLAQDLGQ